MLLGLTIATRTDHQSCHSSYATLLGPHLIRYLLPHPQSHLLQCQLTQLQDISGIEEMVKCRLYLILSIDLPCFQPLHKFFCREVDVHYLIGFLQHTVGDALFHLNAHHPLHLVIQTLNVLDIDGRKHMDAGIEQFHHILPPLGVAATFHIRMGQLIYNHDLWVYTQNSIEIHLFHLLTFVEHLLAGDNGQPFQCFHRVGTAVRLHIAIRTSVPWRSISRASCNIR